MILYCLEMITQRSSKTHSPFVIKPGHEHDRTLPQVRERRCGRCLQARSFAPASEECGQTEEGVGIRKYDVNPIANVVGDTKVHCFLIACQCRLVAVLARTGRESCTWLADADKHR